MAEKRKSVLITGCSAGGIGHALAREFNAKGLRVFATARKADSVPELATEGIETLSLEVDKAESVAALCSEIDSRTGGRLDYLVNNGEHRHDQHLVKSMAKYIPESRPQLYRSPVAALDVEYSEIQQTFNVNVFAVMMICQSFAPMLIAAKGTIVQIGSVAAITPYVFGSVYNASKAALHQYSDTLRAELAPFGVNVTTIITGGVQSRIARTERTLPANSIYTPVATEYDRRTRHSQEGAMPNDAYARSVVSQVLKRNPKFYVWEGAKVWLVWFMHSIMGKRFQNYAFYRMFNLWKLVPGQAGKEKGA